MSYVDIGWPLGVALIGALTWSLSQGHWLRVAVVSGVYLFIGLRMGLAAVHLWRQGHLKVELPRYEYQKRRWARAKKTNVHLAMQVEASVQGLANASFLAFPAMIIASNPALEIAALEIAGLVLWCAAYAMETIADAQKTQASRLCCVPAADQYVLPGACETLAYGGMYGSESSYHFRHCATGGPSMTASRELGGVVEDLVCLRVDDGRLRHPCT